MSVGVTSPLRAARQAFRYAWGRHYARLAMWAGLFVTAVMVAGIWLPFRHMPPTHDVSAFEEGCLLRSDVRREKREPIW